VIIFEDLFLFLGQLGLPGVVKADDYLSIEEITG